MENSSNNLVEMPVVTGTAMKCFFIVDTETNKSCDADSSHRCTTCGRPKCGQHSSNVDPSQCQFCCADVGIEVSVMTKNEEDFDLVADEHILRRYEAKHIKFTGQHWLDNQFIIHELSDEKLKSSLEYHKQMVKLMEEEQLTRKIKKAKKTIAAAPILRRARAGVTSVTEEKKTTVRRSKAALSPEEALEAAIRSGALDPKKLLEMLQQRAMKKNLGIKDVG